MLRVAIKGVLARKLRLLLTSIAIVLGVGFVAGAFFLTDAMRDAVGGDGTALMQLADQYADRNPGGQYAGNIMEVIYAVNCLDKPDTNDLAERHRLSEESLKDAPTWGEGFARDLAQDLVEVRRLAEVAVDGGEADVGHRIEPAQTLHDVLADG